MSVDDKQMLVAVWHKLFGECTRLAHSLDPKGRQYSMSSYNPDSQPRCGGNVHLNCKNGDCNDLPCEHSSRNDWHDDPSGDIKYKF